MQSLGGLNTATFAELLDGSGLNVTLSGGDNGRNSVVTFLCNSSAVPVYSFSLNS